MGHDEAAEPRSDALPERVVRGAFRNFGLVLGLWGCALLVLSPGVAALRIDTSTGSIVDRADPAYAFHKYSQDLFGGEEVLVVALRSEEPFDRRHLTEVSRLTDVFEQLPDIRRVDSLSSTPLIHVNEAGDLELDAPLDAGVPKDRAGQNAFAKRLESDRIAARNFFSDDGHTLAMTLVLEGNPSGRFQQLVEAVRAEVEGLDAFVTGVPVFRSEINVQTQSELIRLVPWTAAVLALLLFAFFRSAIGVALPLLCGTIGSFVMLGAMGAYETPLTLLSMILPSIVMALGCAFVMHLLAAARQATTREEMETKLAGVAYPIALSGLTTTLALLSIGMVRVDAVREVGVYGALGVFATTVATLTVGPCLLGRLAASPDSALLGDKPPLGSEWLRRSARERLLTAATAHRRLLVVGWSIGILGLAIGLFNLSVETDATQWFRESSAVRIEYDTIQEALSGISPVNIVIESNDGKSLLEPERLDAIDRLTTHLASLDEVGKAISVTDPLRQLNGGFRDDATQPLPGSRAEAEQYLVLLSSVEAIGDLITEDRLAANVVLRVNDNASGSLRAIATRAERWWRQNGPAETRARGTGTMFEFARAEDELVYGQLRGMGLALLAIGGILWASLRSLRLAGLALIPNLFPIVAVFGFMGLVGVALDAGTVMLGSLALGIAVDDTVHLVTGVERRTAMGSSTQTSLAQTLGETLPPLIYTTLAVSLSFGALSFSDFTYIQNLGWLVAAVMVICLAADLLLLPALLLASEGQTRPAAQ